MICALGFINGYILNAACVYEIEASDIIYLHIWKKHHSQLDVYKGHEHSV